MGGLNEHQIHDEHYYQYGKHNSIIGSDLAHLQSYRRLVHVLFVSLGLMTWLSRVIYYACQPGRGLAYVMIGFNEVQ